MNLALSLSRSLALSLTASLGIAISANTYAGCVLILGASPPPINNSTSDNVGTYDCDGYGTCTLIDSYFDASAPYTPLEPDEEEVDLTPENPNANSAAGNTATKAGATTSDWCSGGLGGGGGGGGSGGVGFVITLRPIHPGVRSEITLRPFYRAYGGSGGAGGNGGTRAMRESKTIQGGIAFIGCNMPYEERLVVINPMALALRADARRGDSFVVVLSNNGHPVTETWEFIAGGIMSGGTILNGAPVSSGCDSH